MGKTEGGAGIEALVADAVDRLDHSLVMGTMFGVAYSSQQSTEIWVLARALLGGLRSQQAVVRVLRSMDRRGLLGKELRDALAALNAPPEGEG